MHDFPKYRSHKIVGAAQIIGIGPTRVRVSVDGKEINVPIGAEMTARYSPVPGDYIVQYEPDGYLSFSPKQPFEDGYTRIDHVIQAAAAVPKPTVGRIVHYRPAPNECGADENGKFNGTDVVAAMIVQVHSDGTNGAPACVSLRCDPPFAAPFMAGSRHRGDAIGNWFWPPRD